MRIRSIRPEFWSSEDIARLSWDDRLIFIGLWSYVDDNGVGRDIDKLIVADLFPLDEDTHGALKKIAGALKHLETGGQITRYTVAGKRFLHITAWDKHQKINRPSEGRYPLPTCGNADIHEPLTEDSLRAQSILSAGEGEKGRRGEGETPSSADADAAFDDFWSLCPRKVGKDAARKAWRSAVKRAGTADQIIAGLNAHLPVWAGMEERFIPHPSTWLNEGRWPDRPSVKPQTDVPHYWAEAGL